MPVAKSFHYLFPTVVAFALSSAAWAQSAAPASTAEKPPLAEQLVDSLNGVFGKHPGARAVHAKGIVTTGEFIPSGDAKSVTKASFLQNKSEAIPVTVRFSNFAGLPDIPDNHPGLASPRDWQSSSNSATARPPISSPTRSMAFPRAQPKAFVTC